MYKSEEKPINSDCPFGTVEYKNKCWPYFVDDLNNNNKLHYYNLLKEYPELAPYEFDKKDKKVKTTSKVTINEEPNYTLIDYKDKTNYTDISDKDLYFNKKRQPLKIIPKKIRQNNIDDIY